MYLTNLYEVLINRGFDVSSRICGQVQYLVGGLPIAWIYWHYSLMHEAGMDSVLIEEGTGMRNIHVEVSQTRQGLSPENGPETPSIMRTCDGHNNPPTSSRQNTSHNSPRTALPFALALQTPSIVWGLRYKVKGRHASRNMKHVTWEGVESKTEGQELTIVRDESWW